MLLSRSRLFDYLNEMYRYLFSELKYWLDLCLAGSLTHKFGNIFVTELG